MILFTGPLCSGKRQAAEALAETRGLEQPVLVEHAEAFLFEDRTRTFSPEELAAKARELSRADLVTVNDVGGGLVPLDPDDRRAREAAGRFSCLLAEQAEEVYRVFCGLPQKLK